MNICQWAELAEGIGTHSHGSVGTGGVINHWNNLPGAVMDSLLQQLFKSRSEGLFKKDLL